MRGLYVYAWIHLYTYTPCIRIRVYAYSCLCARVKAVSGPFFREGGQSRSQILSLCVYNMPTVSTISRPRLFVVHSVYKLCTVSTDYTQVDMSLHSVYKICTVSTDRTCMRNCMSFAQCLQNMHNVHRLDMHA